ncbi:hypothetical protein [Mesorhizobium sp. M0571]|uniref:hypothetical protein n=1 Tax=Mesorhizobium sp. M0571 TaxID=2956960 RepID=UPI00333AB362
MSESTFRRYTNLASALHILRNRCLTLLSPETWDDRNDAFFMSEYKRLRDVKSVLAICLADREETYHHWSSPAGLTVCASSSIVTSYWLRSTGQKGVIHRYVTYELLSNANTMRDVDLQILPFTKRWPYGDEREYRAVFVSADDRLKAFLVPVELAAIKRITLSPWLAPALVDSVKDTLKLLAGCKGMGIYRSTLIDNKQWQKLAGRVAPAPSIPST